MMSLCSRQMNQLFHDIFKKRACFSFFPCYVVIILSFIRHFSTNKKVKHSPKKANLRLLVQQVENKMAGNRDYLFLIYIFFKKFDLTLVMDLSI